ncbi:MAG: hypothetical protein J6U96_00725 [Elusimicrobiaceae bacterium]|nr:hypothetical protein [Elusimicrobiaceae bacterium]
MSKKSKGQGKTCDNKTASTLAAASIMQYFKEENYGIVTFFPNSVCVQSKKCKYKSAKDNSSD